ncbi:MAG TPA: MBL fold metallo-hydrolase [Deltaproteobacteria bacterium]|nr:MAG: MBL fold metallo-hydrolase [Deltaproteobacteria bacterium GWA2_55_82]OGQ62805.1 MAG: MBL fold metallo-hydrolase [Deltaproteobacteria bacterium RIFCSPLOWO2_02_FULL_55_12]OIJ73525.1 MAG: MBL fold metallo-hydrolase [Deltaproteobacteria bacterium GWC2_55_46]HBG46256.1 MBL fold metallo-hydrolase [Deltaproteobacteria bacterium]HCY10163.1 MBL fold metallo-hydrolase [Deltaproteobacteria bacterium]
MRLVILGCGTSTGVPVIGCHCEVCASANPLNKRTRSSLLVQVNGKNILIDTSTDLRSQSLANGVESIDAVLYTHPHADHIHGIDELRAFNLAAGGAAIPCFGGEHTIERIRTMFDYIFREDGRDGWKPNLTTNIIRSPFDLFGEKIVPVEVMHGQTAIYGYRIGDMAYITDCSAIPEGTLPVLRGVKILILGALRQKPHPTHFSITEAIAASQAISAHRTVFTHLSHNVDYARDNPALPPGIEFAFDGMALEV